MATQSRGAGRTAALRRGECSPAGRCGGTTRGRLRGHLRGRQQILPTLTGRGRRARHAEHSSPTASSAASGARRRSRTPRLPEKPDSEWNPTEQMFPDKEDSTWDPRREPRNAPPRASYLKPPDLSGIDSHNLETPSAVSGPLAPWVTSLFAPPCRRQQHRDPSWITCLLSSFGIGSRQADGHGGA